MIMNTHSMGHLPRITTILLGMVTELLPAMIMKLELLRLTITRIMAILLGMVTELLPAMIMNTHSMGHLPRITTILLGMVTELLPAVIMKMELLRRTITRIMAILLGILWRLNSRSNFWAILWQRSWMRKRPLFLQAWPFM